MTNAPQDPTKTAVSGTFLPSHTHSSPVLERAARALFACEQPFADQADAAAFRDELMRMRDADREGEELLYLQSRVLDALFSRCVVAALDHPGRARNPTSPQYIDSDGVYMALRAQRQCTHTVDTLSRLRMRKKFASELKGPQNRS